MSTPTIVVPENYTLHKENSAYLLLPSEDGPFLNTIQEFNRDLSVACIRTWAERYNREKAARVQSKSKNPPRKRRKLNTSSEDINEQSSDPTTEKVDGATGNDDETPQFRPVRINILEPLSATGLRAIRYCKEIPLVKQVIANDLSKDATAAMRRNVDINGLNPDASQVEGETASEKSDGNRPSVLVHQGDASALMYSAKARKQLIHVVDLDPYGTAAPFIDAGVQVVTDNGLLCVTCTDLAVLAGTNYPEKCFANYGGTPAKAEYCHEGALRLVLGSIATAASRYGRSITPLLSLSIDFYVRVFVQVKTSPVEVKKLSSKMATYYICTFCQNWHEQPLGKVVERVSEGTGAVNLLYRTSAGPPAEPRCEECGSNFHVAGPMWRGPIHDKSFATEALELVNNSPQSFGTHARMQGMLTLASEELDTPFYFTPSKIANSFHAEAPSLIDFASSLLNAGHQVSRSHAAAGSLKSSATRSQLHDIFRTWVKSHPVKLSNIKDGSPALKLLAKEASFQADFTRHPNALASHVKLLRYQHNPVPNWGPATKAGKRRSGKDTGQEDVAIE